MADFLQFNPLLLHPSFLEMGLSAMLMNALTVWLESITVEVFIEFVVVGGRRPPPLHRHRLLPHCQSHLRDLKLHLPNEQSFFLLRRYPYSFN